MSAPISVKLLFLSFFGMQLFIFGTTPSLSRVSFALGAVLLKGGLEEERVGDRSRSCVTMPSYSVVRRHGP